MRGDYGWSEQGVQRVSGAVGAICLHCRVSQAMASLSVVLTYLYISSKVCPPVPKMLLQR